MASKAGVHMLRRVVGNSAVRLSRNAAATTNREYMKVQILYPKAACKIPPSCLKTYNNNFFTGFMPLLSLRRHDSTTAGELETRRKYNNSLD